MYNITIRNTFVFIIFIITLWANKTYAQNTSVMAVVDTSLLQNVADKTQSMTSSASESTPDPCISLSSQQEITQCAISEYTALSLQIDSLQQQLTNTMDIENATLFGMAYNNWQDYSNLFCDCETALYNFDDFAIYTRYQCLNRLAKQYYEQLINLPK